MKVRKIFLFSKPAMERERISEAIEEIRSALPSSEIFVQDDTQYIPGVRKIERVGDVDIVIVLGGDGAILRACKKVILSGSDIPVVGANMGRVGFLTFGNEKLKDMIRCLLEDEFKEDVKDVLEGRVVGAGSNTGYEGRAGERSKSREEERREGREGSDLLIYAINDFVMKGGDDGICEFSIFVGDEFAGRVRADAVIVSTQTGSTAYNLSVGGPIIFPGVSAKVINFVAPFSLNIRPVVVPPNVKIKLTAHKSSVVLADGKYEGNTRELEVSNTQKKIRILKSKNSSFFETLRQKIGWIS